MTMEGLKLGKCLPLMINSGSDTYETVVKSLNVNESLESVPLDLIWATVYVYKYHKLLDAQKKYVRSPTVNNLLTKNKCLTEIHAIETLFDRAGSCAWVTVESVSKLFEKFNKSEKLGNKRE